MTNNKVFLRDVAKASGVSLSTVGRVLNERGGVSERKQRLVIEAAKALEVKRLLPPLTRGSLRFDLVATQADTDFYRRLDAALMRYSELAGTRLALHRSAWSPRQRSKLLTFIRKPPYRRHGLIVIAQDEEDIRTAVLESADSGVATVLLTSDMSDVPHSLYVGIDNYVAGLTAGGIIRRSLHRPGRVLLLAGSLSYRAHQQRSRGFLDALEATDTPLQVEGPVDMQDDAEMARQAVSAALHHPEPLLGIYNTGTASRGIREVVSRLPVSQRPLWIAHEASQEHHQMVNDGLISFVIDQDAEAQALIAIQQLLYLNGEIAEPPITLRPSFHLVTTESWLS